MKVCGKKDIHVPGCDDCQELEERVDAVEKCCDDAHDEIDTLNTDKADKDYVDDSIETVNQTIVDVADTLGERIDNIITASEPSVTTLWEGVMESIGDSANLSEDVNDFDYLDIYYRTSVDESEGYYNTVRIPADQFANYTITVGGTLSPLGESPNLSQYLTQLSFVDDTATIDNIREWAWNGSQSSDASDDPQAETGVTIYRIDGVKEAGGNAEIADARIGVDGTVYPSLGDAIRGQIQDTRDMIPQLVKTVNGNPIVIDDAQGEVKNLDVELLPIQDLNGYDKPWAAGAGVNKYEPLEGVNNGVTWETQADGTSKITGTAAATTWTYLTEVHDLPWRGITAGSNVAVYADNAQLSLQCEIAEDVWMNLANASGSAVVVLIPAQATKIRLLQYAENQASTSGTTFNKIAKYYLAQSDTFSSWTPYTNICPITGHDSVTVGVTGVNQFNEQWEQGGLNGTTGEETSSTSFSRSDFFKAYPNTTYYVYGSEITSTTEVFVFPYKADGTYISPYTKLSSNGTYTTPQECEQIRLQVRRTIDTVANYKYSINLPSTDTAYHAYHGQSKTVTLPHTVYGAGVGFTSGSGLERMITPVDLGSYNWTALSGYTGIFYTYISDVKPCANGTLCNALCSIYKAVKGNDLASNDKSFVAGMNNSTQIMVQDTAYTSATDFKTAMNGVQLCYELATPTDLSTTPTSLTLYNGDNVISSDGVMTMDYVQDMAIVIRKIEAQI